MKSVWVNKKDVNLDDVGFEIRTVESLLEILFEHYFGKTQEAVEKEPYSIVNDYERYGNALYATLNLLRNAQETLEIARQNSERETVPYYGDLSAENQAYINGQIAMLIKGQSPPMSDRHGNGE